MRDASAEFRRRAALLRNEKSRILRQWSERVLAEVPAARKQERPALINSLPAFLEALAGALESGSGRGSHEEQVLISREHGQQRAETGAYTIDQIIHEYCLLRKVTFEVLEEAAPVPAPEREIIVDGIERAMREAAACFDETQQEAVRSGAAELEEADRRKNEFLAMLGHELRTPLGAVTNALYILDQLDLPDPRAERQVKVATRQTRHLVRLVNDLLDVSRIIRGTLELRQERTDLRAVAQHAAQTVQPAVAEKGHTMECSIAPEPLWLEADPERLEQVLTNLLTNAVRYTEPGGRIVLSTEREDGHATVRVRDTGVGIAPEMLPRIFDMFTQAEASAGRAGGLGMGLTLVRRLVELHGGTVAAASDGPSTGSEFVVRLPLQGETGK